MYEIDQPKIRYLVNYKFTVGIEIQKMHYYAHTTCYDNMYIIT